MPIVGGNPPSQLPDHLDGVQLRTRAAEAAVDLQGPILMLHGMEDDNVSFDNATMLVAKLHAKACPVEMMFYPGQRHSIVGERQKLHLFATHMDFSERRLGGPRKH